MTRDDVQRRYFLMRGVYVNQSNDRKKHPQVIATSIALRDRSFPPELSME